MFLKELEIYGFKSFAKKIKISFNPGITAIVGPNGCGKSNIIDAVRWVLGEQNIRSIRGTQLTDIIFSGNHLERPLNMAEVSIVLNNSDKILPLDWEEISIKRRIYRSGETENFINGIPCKLRDIQELFMNTGLGKNTYSIIAQGEIDLILSAKPSDRRYLFEEAASIAKYKYEKQKALKNIGEIDINLNRIFSIISEIKNQLDFFEEEAKNLKKYKSYQQEIKDLELYLIYQKYYLYKTNLLKIKEKIERLKENREEIFTSIEKQETKINTLKEELTNLNREKEKYIYENYELDNKKNAIQNEFNLICQKKNDLEKRLISLKEDSENLSRKISLLNENKKELYSDISKINKKLDELNKKLNNLKIEFNKGIRFINSISSAQNNFKKISKSFYEKELFLREREIKYNTTINILNSNLDKIRKNKIILEEKIKFMNEKENEYRKALKEDKKRMEKNNIKKIEERIKEVEGILNKLRLSLEKDKQNINIKEEKKDILVKSIKNNLYMEEEKEKLFISKYYQKHPDGICTKLIRLIDYIPPEYEKIIEISLKESLNSFVVDDIHSTLDVIYSLFKNEIDEIKIIPFELIRNTKIIPSENNVKINGEGICGFASQLITCKEEYKKLFKVLLGNILIVENTQAALNLYEKCLGIYKIVSLNGLVIDLNGTINLGISSKDKDENVFYIEREINKLDKEIEKLKIKIRDDEFSLNKYNNIYCSLIEENKKLKDILQKSERDTKENLDNLNRTSISLNELKNTLNNLAQEEENIIKEKKSISKKQCIFNKINNNIYKYNTNINNNIKIIDNIINQKNIIISSIKNNINSIDNYILINKQKEINLKDKDENISFYLNEYFSDLNTKKNIIKEYEKDINKLKKTAEEYKAQLEELNRRDYSFIKSKDELERVIQEKSNLLENIIKDKDEKLLLFEQNKDEQHKEEIIEVQYQEKQKNIENLVIENYKILPEDLKLYKNKSSSQREANQKIEILRNDIIKMGEINFEAETRYQNQLIRYNILWEKYNEISRAKKILDKINREIDQIATKRFIETFNQVKVHFKEIFKKLFNGGEADLYLNLEEDTLKSGIDIIARPPGKETRSIELLSSGERAITAIALLLALWKVNPSPFCFFDEIDTALDEINTERFSSLLKGEELGKSQLVIITHQKTTMEAADTLYGITMEDSGISKLVSVKFSK
ncbi:MAG: chromosome segregation protein SMC [Atribacterota bacterium]